MALALLPMLERAARRTPQPPLRRSPQIVCTETEQPRLSVVIVNYCLWEPTAGLVRQLLAAPCTQRGEVEVMVVDNHSPFHPLARRLRRLPGVSLRRWGRNRGFARAVNEGCRLSRGQWILLLNPDISVSRDFLDGVLALMERLPRQEPQASSCGTAMARRSSPPARSPRSRTCWLVSLCRESGGSTIFRAPAGCAACLG